MVDPSQLVSVADLLRFITSSNERSYKSAFDNSNFINSAAVDPFLLISVKHISCNVIMLNSSSLRNI